MGNNRTLCRRQNLLIAGFVAFFALCASIQFARAEDPALVVGPNECAECHKKETSIWQKTHHFSTFRDLPRTKEATEIAEKMGIRRIKSDSACLNCHFTEKLEDGKPEPIAGIACESCHGSGKDWYKVHSGFSGKKEGQETPDEIKARWAKSEAAGMIRPSMIYTLARNCFSCHLVPDEKLVNVGGHAAGSAFELVAWSQGEIRHNTWYNKGASNPAASTERQRMLFIVGRIAELETALIGVSKATTKADYALKMATRANNARKVMASLAKLLPDAPELMEIAQIGAKAGLKLNNEAELKDAAGKISVLGLKFANAYDGKAFAAVDKYLPAPDKYKGTVSN
ncbi:cytochrome c family protein [Breoghania sp.]|uniref:cytochrome c family protein n=1 Tax=Breoghania sp. TaxID=2065378 RepID=UPI002AA70351|nr:cytochrome c family protein [Breoghania sp.]